MVLPRLTRRRPWRAVVVVALCVSAAVACGGGRSPAQKAADAAEHAKAACEVFANFTTPSGSDQAAQRLYAQKSAQAFRRAAELSRVAANDDPRWETLAGSASREAAAFVVIANGITAGLSSPAAENNYLLAVRRARATRPIFIAQCAKADPDKFQPIPTTSPSPVPRASGTPSSHVPGRSAQA